MIKTQENRRELENQDGERQMQPLEAWILKRATLLSQYLLMHLAAIRYLLWEAKGKVLGKVLV